MGLSEEEYAALSEEEKAEKLSAAKEIQRCRGRCRCPGYPRSAGIHLNKKDAAGAVL